MNKSFFVVVPFTLAEVQGISPKKALGAQRQAVLSEEDFQMCKNQLWQRTEFVVLGLRRCGMNAIPLSTTELIELLWSIHHPNEAEAGYWPQIPPELIQEELPL